jgi:hypothetical protein
MSGFVSAKNPQRVKKRVKRASYDYHKHHDLRLDGVQIGAIFGDFDYLREIPFILVRACENDQTGFQNYLAMTPERYKDFNYRDVKEGTVVLLEKFSLTEIKNSKTRESFAEKMTEIIGTYFFDPPPNYNETLERLNGERPKTLELFMD